MSDVAARVASLEEEVQRSFHDLGDRLDDIDVSIDDLKQRLDSMNELLVAMGKTMLPEGKVEFVPSATGPTTERPRG